ncbi:hypothetical protein A2442_00780 [Candidatus Campbellbacteria bacterium RIFOXYC2_FULL_35_25]|uniref:CMP/dCMP-type deaminase domain-containing protein n=1 Tax=Candidatus Campbellbacteria bacterium RIFOXYC2_FULL_35_25 TaxID=1797582 RepID=A0A1F5EIS9_9BACT|nr:MAG: hypothetical protein A2442_00780 [Candidatus Campbellbacteria bacterium RIFOXYC2_FULL_35_25]
MSKILVSYIPALHKGYLNLFCECGAKTLYIIGDDLINLIPDLDYVSRKDSLRAISPEMVMDAVRSWNIFDSVHVLNLNSIQFLVSCGDQIIMPDEDVSRSISQKYFLGKDVIFHQIFLRWNKVNTTAAKKLSCDRISLTNFEKEVVGVVLNESQKSWDWWRQVGGVITRGEEILLVAHNQHLPEEQNPYIFGDPRAVFNKGVNIELSTAEHAEAILIAEAAKRGICLEGTYLFVSDFPCPPCAKLVGRSGIKKCYFINGYAMLDGEEVLKDRNVEIIQIIM